MKLANPDPALAIFTWQLAQATQVNNREFATWLQANVADVSYRYALSDEDIDSDTHVESTFEIWARREFCTRRPSAFRPIPTLPPAPPPSVARAESAGTLLQRVWRKFL